MNALARLKALRASQPEKCPGAFTEAAPTKPSKPPFVGFEGAIQEKAPEILPAPASAANEVPDRETIQNLPSNLSDLAARVCLWRVPGKPSRFIVAGPDHDLRISEPGAVPLFDDAHRERVRRIAERGDGPLPVGVLDDLAERAAILEHDAGESREDAQRMAVQLVQCRRCLHFSPALTHPLAGIGACATGGWAQEPQQVRADHGEIPHCGLFEARP